MRVDKFLVEMGVATRTEAAKAAKRGEIIVDGKAIKKPDLHIDPEKSEVIFRGVRIEYAKYVYVMLNKPDGYVSATEDGREKVVLELLSDELRKRNIFPCGRLDKHTTGLMLLCDNGELSHRLLAPKSHVKKRYLYTSKFELSDDDKARLEEGTVLDDGYETKPSEIELYADRKSGIITLVEGKYHQIKRMFESVGNKITSLERISFGPLELDENLARGEWRYLTDEEIKLLESHK